MHIRRAVGAATLALTVVATLSGCADDPQDKAFGGFGEAPAPPTMPNPSLSNMPTGMPDIPEASGGTSSGGSSSGTSGGTSSGTSGSSSGGSGPTAQPTYNQNATGEVIGQNCRYDRASSKMSYDVDIQNSSSDYAFRYSFTVEFKVGKYANSTVASKTIASRPNTVTVSAGGDRTVSMHTSHSTNERLTYSCQVTSARKSPSS
ncbi:hypothetical protein LHJ74_03140 [Streptomyces sp. N2-109]|uniref:Lipoprotein n=1 Tax=Streptomyces gossypii TaxID=2883101 RepID=A0ABT2JNU6_9ACTN|nr:hypothetical protein [Streptomyces gossypii]MCT2588939.1 hypothetical protein [Streptomyces gossypii]